MKRIIISLLILAIFMLPACTNDGTGVKTTHTTPTTTTTKAEHYTPVEPSAIFNITEIEQKYYDALKEWSDFVTIYYEIKNTGGADISYYVVYFTVTCEWGNQYQDWTNGSHIWIDEEWSDYKMIKVYGEEVLSAVITDYELRAYSDDKKPEVVYEISGTADKVDITLNNAYGNTEQYSDVIVPKRYAYTTFSDWFLYISAQNMGEYGTVEVTIYYNGEVLERAFSSGAYVIATASGSKP